MQITSYKERNVQVLKVGEPRIDASVAIHFKDRMREETQDQTGPFVLDLSDVRFIDSSGLGAVVAALKQLEPGQTLDLAGLTPAVEKVFRLTRMDTIFRIHANPETALSARAS